MLGGRGSEYHNIMILTTPAGGPAAPTLLTVIQGMSRVSVQGCNIVALLLFSLVMMPAYSQTRARQTSAWTKHCCAAALCCWTRLAVPGSALQQQQLGRSRSYRIKALREAKTQITCFSFWCYRCLSVSACARAMARRKKHSDSAAPEQKHAHQHTNVQPTGLGKQITSAPGRLAKG
jgi:hypothetical protein